MKSSIPSSYISIDLSNSDIDEEIYLNNNNPNTNSNHHDHHINVSGVSNVINNYFHQNLGEFSSDIDLKLSSLHKKIEKDLKIDKTNIKSNLKKNKTQINYHNNQNHNSISEYCLSQFFVTDSIESQLLNDRLEYIDYQFDNKSESERIYIENLKENETFLKEKNLQLQKILEAEKLRIAKEKQAEKERKRLEELRLLELKKEKEEKEKQLMAEQKLQEKLNQEKLQLEQQKQKQLAQNNNPNNNKTQTQSSLSSSAELEYSKRFQYLKGIQTETAKFKGPSKIQLQIMINRTITQISSTMNSVNEKASALILKLQELSKLSPQGNSGIEYLSGLEMIANKLVAQAESRIKLQHSAAFPFAWVAQVIVSYDSRFEDLFIALLGINCCFIIPKYQNVENYKGNHRQYRLDYGFNEVEIENDTNNNNNNNNNKSSYNNDGSRVGYSWESEESYFERQAGYIALYAAYIQIPLPSNRHAIHSAGWIWLARLCNQVPKTATANVLLAFLSQTFYSLYNANNAQATKLLLYINEHIVPRIHASGQKIKLTNARRAALTRLELFIQKTLVEIKKNNVSQPEGRTLPTSQDSDTTEQQVQPEDYN